MRNFLAPRGGKEKLNPPDFKFMSHISQEICFSIYPPSKQNRRIYFFIFSSNQTKKKR